MTKDQKKTQEVVNYVAKNLYDMALNEACSSYDGYVKRAIMEKSKRLRNCQAWVIETENFYLLISYNTIVAVIEKGSDILADVLRDVYGYTSTSAQHISKFRHDYGADKWGCKIEYRYYPVN